MLCYNGLTLHNLYAEYVILYSLAGSDVHFLVDQLVSAELPLSLQAGFSAALLSCLPL